MLSIITNIRDEIEIYLIYIDGKYIFPLRLIIRRIKNKLNDFTTYTRRLLMDMKCKGYNDVDDAYKQLNSITTRKNTYCAFIITILLFMMLWYIFIF